MAGITALHGGAVRVLELRCALGLDLLLEWVQELGFKRLQRGSARRACGFGNLLNLAHLCQLILGEIPVTGLFREPEVAESAAVLDHHRAQPRLDRTQLSNCERCSRCGRRGWRCARL